jgi:hypothetical protein
MHINGVIARRDEGEQRVGELLGEVALPIAREARPGINGHVVEW